MAIEVVDYDDAWPRHAETACAELRDSLPGLFTAIEPDLATRCGSPAGYTRAKTELIQKLTDRARAARGLPSVQVWEE